MTASVGTLAKLQKLEDLFRQGYRSDSVDMALDKIIALEAERLRRKLAEIEAHLRALEARYHWSTDDFYARYERGELGDEADFIEWSAFRDMRQSLAAQLAGLADLAT